MHRLVPLILLLAIGLSATIPKGWMPKVMDDGHMVLILCTADEMVELLVDANGEPVPLHEQTGEERSPCAFSAVADVAIVADGPHPLLLESALTALWQHQGFPHESAGFHRRYDARGPPSLS
ncbi:DUF2946 domain-containing protein [Shimia sp. R10_1]|uniref:DUF2946 domain-containing protein n=1 Tax=Shimia sp. R10_1 TaxID=2821095 RepID=UPI001ADAC552|nr:DUF2946 domain-containing protein [Shimia sp. R10_1]MBO9474408.1 DUF2946 domain-containing protein [Shimia sp. R10_1]